MGKTFISERGLVNSWLISMKIAVLSDFHFGYGYNTELEHDSFDNLEEAMNAALRSDLIIVAGDIFDTRFPRTPVWARAIRLLVKPMIEESSGVKFVSCTKNLRKVLKRTLEHIPVIALHGNHERRGRSTNTLETLENAGILIHLHMDTIIFEKDGIQVAIHGMSWVPDRYAKKDLEEWNPKPVPGCVNILVLHQSISPYLYSPLDRPSISKEDLPKGFDVIIDGHLHSAGQELINGTPLLFPGSTVITQFDKAEAHTEKGFYEIDITPVKEAGNKHRIIFSFQPITSSRRFFFEDVEVDGRLRDRVEAKLDELLELKNKKNPLIKLRIKGKENEYLSQDIKDIEKKYSDRAIIRFVKELESPEITEKIEFLRNLRDQKMSAEEIGLNLLHKNLDDLKFNSSFQVENVFSLLVEGRVDEVFGILTEPKQM